MDISWHWTPGTSVGPFRFGDEAAPIIQLHQLVKLKRDSPIVDWDTYEIPDCESRVMVEDGRIARVLCCDAINYMGVDLLGLTLNDARALLGRENQLEENVAVWEVVLSYYELGLTLYFRGGVVDDAICNAPEIE
jgi:hypothetical protein